MAELLVKSGTAADGSFSSAGATAWDGGMSPSSGVLSASFGGTGTGFFGVSGLTALRTLTFPDANATIARIDAAQTFSGDQIFSGNVGIGTPTPGRKLVIAAGNNVDPQLRLEGLAGNAQAELYANANAGRLDILVGDGAINLATRMSIDRTTGNVGIGTPSPAEKLHVAGGVIALDKTITAVGTTGAQTINKPTGSVNFAAAATSLVVTNSFATVNSIICCQVATNDATMKSVQVVASAGSFTIFANAAATAETRVNFILTN